ncbi:bacterial Ig-like domain-containing protein [Anaerosporobacter faecicola]|uniref:bacterial Ig-like domain-containing protein n=1 Tax=Anaerosporobacter faecicola TaxID=2718714 RepID=UPI00143958DA|nr:bacterial Ig-like domain-containing protein [Anaerosporobacter faecicola]
MKIRKVFNKRSKLLLSIVLSISMVMGQLMIPTNTESKAAAYEGTIESVEVKSTLPAYMKKSKLSSMPSNISVSVNGGDAFTTPVTWSVKSGNASYVGSAVVLKGILPEVENYEITANVVVYSTKLVYFVDCGSVLKSVTPTVYNEIKALDGVNLKNTVADQNSDGTWGYTTTSAGSKGANTTLAASYLSQLNATGYYGNSSSGNKLGYIFDLEEGTYQITTGHYEWWSGPRTSNVTVNSTSIGSCTVSSSQVQGYVSGEFVMDAAGTATVTLTKGSSGDDAALTYIAIEKIEADSSIDTSAWDSKLAEANDKINSGIYSEETETKLRTAVESGKDLIKVVESAQDVTDAITMVQYAIDGLALADKTTLINYVEEPLDTGLYTVDAAFTTYKELIQSSEIQSVYTAATPTRTQIADAVIAIEAARAGLTTTRTQIVVDGNDVDVDNNGDVVNKFQGFGAVTCNNTSNLLIDYKEENPTEYWEMMNMLFNTETGAGLSHVKVELGGDVNSSSGTEPATMRSEDEEANVRRGAGWVFAADALTINPDITIEALRWGEPSWTWDGGFEARYKWYKETIDAAYDEFGIKLSYLSPGQNENNAGSGSVSVSDNFAWIKYCAQRLNAETEGRYDYSQIKIVASDSHCGSEAIAKAMLADPELMDLIDVIGDHYQIRGNASLTTLNEEYGKEVWYSEGVAPMINAKERINAQPEYGGVGGTVGMIDLATRYICAYQYAGTTYSAKMTRWEFQPAIAGFYQGSAYSPKQLIGAFYPWSGYYEADGGLQVVQHFTLFSETNWHYIEGACYGDGTYNDGGVKADTGTNHYLTIKDPDTDDYSMIFANNTANERVYQVQAKNLDTFKNQLNVWETRGPDDGEEYDANWLQKIDTITPTVSSSNGISYYNITVKPYSMVTVTTLLDKGTSYVTGQNESSASNDILALPYTDDFEYSEYSVDENGMTYLERRAGTPRYTADQRGAFEVQSDADNTANHVLTQVISKDIIPAEWNVWGGSTRTTYTPNTWLGDQRWANYKASLDVKIDTSGSDNNFAGIGIRQNESSSGSDSSAYGIRIYHDGTWKLTDSATVVQQGIIDGFDSSIWHNLAIEGKENVITAYVDGVEVVTYTDTSSPNLCGRLSILSGYYNTYYDNLIVEPVDGYAPYSEKIDDASDSIEFSETGWTFQQSGYAHYNRTLMAGSESGVILCNTYATNPGDLNKIYYYKPDGSSWGYYDDTYSSTTGSYAELTFAGTGIDYYAKAQNASTNVNVYIDGELKENVTLNSTGVVYSISNLENTQHTIKIEQAAGCVSIVKFKVHDSQESTTFTSHFTGTGFNLFGATSASTIDVYVDGELVDDDAAIPATGNRDCSYFLRGLTDGEHILKVVVESGTFTLDGIDAIGSIYGVPFNKTITGIEVKTAPTRVDYATSESIVDLSGIVVTVNYEDGTAEDFSDPGLFTPTAIAQDQIGEQNITIKYRGFTSYFTINVVSGLTLLDPVSLTVLTMPNKTIYGVGDELNTNGLVVQAGFDSGETLDISDSRVMEFTGYDKTKVGIQDVTVTYRGCSTTFQVTVTDFSTGARLSGIQIIEQPNKVSYEAGESLDTNGLVVVATYDDGSQTEITDLSLLSFTGFNSGVNGFQLVTITYEGKTATFFVEVSGNQTASSDAGESSPVTPGVITNQDETGTTDHSVVPATMKTQISNGMLLVAINVNKDVVRDAANYNKTNNINTELNIQIPASQSILTSIKSEEVTSIYSNISIDQTCMPGAEGTAIQGIIVDKGIIGALQETEKTMQLNIVDESNQIWYSWIFSGKQMKASKDVVTNKNLAIEVNDSESKKEIDTLVYKDKNNTNGYVVTAKETDQLPSGTVLKINVKSQLGYKAGTKLYVYHYNEETGKLESMVKVKYTVEADGCISMNTKYADQLVILEKQADSSVKTTLLGQIKGSTKKQTVKKGKTIYVAPTLPEIIVAVPNYSAKYTSLYGEETMLAMVTYRSSNSSVASVNKNGKVVAKKKGKATITVTVKLENGKSKTFKKTITVK